MKANTSTLRRRVRTMLFLGSAIGASNISCSSDSATSDPAETDNPKQSESKPEVQPTAAHAVSSRAAEYLAKVKAVLPEYSEGGLSDIQAAEARRSFLETVEPLELARPFTSRPLKFIETRSGGRVVYKDDAREHVVKYDTRLGYFRFLSPAQSSALANKDQADSALTKEAARALAEQVFAQLGLPREEQGEVSVGSMMGAPVSANSNPADVKPVVHSRIVEILRQVNGVTVWGSRVLVNIGLDGRPFRTGVWWPHFKLRQGSMMDRQRVESDIAAHLAGRQLKPQEAETLELQLVYRFDDQDLVYEPALMIRLAAADNSSAGNILTYSLQRGML